MPDSSSAPNSGKVIIFSAPSGAGKTTIVRHLLSIFPQLNFSISATSREPRGKEVDGKDYYFLGEETFRQRVLDGEFLEWEEVYSGTMYGTLRSEIERIWNDNKVAIFDMDVIGGLNLKSLYEDDALAVFVMPPNMEELEKRLRGRQTDSPDKIRQRLAKARREIGRSDRFDVILDNNDLDTAKKKAEQLVRDFMSK